MSNVADSAVRKQHVQNKSHAHEMGEPAPPMAPAQLYNVSQIASSIFVNERWVIYR